MKETKPVQEIGKTSATDRDPNTSDKFIFWLAPQVIVNPFDIVEVEQVSHEGKSKTFGLLTTLEHRTDSPSHLANFISSNFGELTEDPNTHQQGTTVTHANVLSNDKDIYMHVTSEKVMRFADESGIQCALGIDAMNPQDRIPAGLIRMSKVIFFVDELNKYAPEGELLLSHAVYRQPVKIIFPKPTFKQQGEDLFGKGVIRFNTAVGPFALPKSLVSAQYIDRLATFLEDNVHLNLNNDGFVITAYFTRKIKLEKETIVWQR